MCIAATFISAHLTHLAAVAQRRERSQRAFWEARRTQGVVHERALAASLRISERRAALREAEMEEERLRLELERVRTVGQQLRAAIAADESEASEAREESHALMLRSCEHYADYNAALDGKK